ncbi:MAG TPA: hypothetical protein VEB18_02075 [Candidatus Paceibacterota bacterium]|nr:hypothetical protein [Candidatus Paceibacterota bacterium]
MKKDGLEWHFPDLQHADSEGLNDPLLQYFGGNHNRYIAREVIQNSIDARKDDTQPVVVKFTRLELPTAEVPGVAELKKHLEVCLEQARSEQNEKAERYYEDAVRAAGEPKTIVLRASDFNTSGLTGEDKDKRGKWHRLVRAVGENQMSGVGGGSYGIGKGAPFVASRMRTVYYSTKNEDGDVIFQGKARLMSHELKGKEYRGVGSFGVEGYKSVRDPKAIPPAFLRQEQGTDISIIGYMPNLAWADELAASVLDNFWMAIYSGTLEVVIGNSSGIGELRIDRSTLRELLEKHCKDSGFIYYKCVIDSSRTFEKQLPLLGLCRLHVRIEEKFPRHIAVMRRPKMVVDTMRFPKTLQQPFAGVFICDDPEGNKILRGMEPPEHDKWDPDLDPVNGRAALSEIREWMKHNLLELAEEESGDPEEIPELEKFLPYDEDSERASESSKSRTQATGTAGRDESAMEVGAERDEEAREIEAFVHKPSSVRDNDKGGMAPDFDDDGKGGSDGGSGGTGDESGGKGAERINTSQARFRIIYTGKKKDRAEYCLVITPMMDQEGGVNIVALGEDSTVYPVSVAEAEEWGKKAKTYKHSGSFIAGLKLKKNKPVRIRIETKSASRYALGIENHEG